MTKSVKIGTPGIKSILRKLRFSQNNFYKSIVEYIWNGFDAKADRVDLIIDVNQTGSIQKMIIKDNGTGITKENLSQKFEPFFESEKVLQPKMEKHTSQLHGCIGIGRLTFFTFAYFANWDTIYASKDKNYKYSIDIAANSLKAYSDSNETKTTEPTGTTVSFSGFQKHTTDPEVIKKILEYLKLEFGWYLELNKPFGKKIFVNGEELDYSSIIGDDSEEFTFKCGSPEKTFKIKYTRWKEKLTEEYSKFYYLNSESQEKYKENTTLNNQGDQFYHSIYISGDYFNNFNFTSATESSQKALSGGVRSDEIFKLLINELSAFLRKKRKPFLKEHSETIIKDLRNDKILNIETKNEVEIIQNQELETLIRGIYEVEPKIFFNLKVEQKKALIGMLKLLMNSDERDQILEIVGQIIDLAPQEKKDLMDLLKSTKLSSIIKTMNVIKHRYEVLEILKKINFEGEFGANEVNHLQSVVETNTWLFGEQYSLIASSEDTFDKALREFRKKVLDEETTEKMSSSERNKQMDVFLCKQLKSDTKIRNIIIELKHPKKKLGEKEVSQIKKYFRIILNEPRFNADNYTWDYILVGSAFDAGGYIEQELENCKNFGESGLIFNPGKNHKINARKWSDLLIECELRHDFINKNLEIQKNNLIRDVITPDDAVKKAK